jgi:hypothetical protein
VRKDDDGLKSIQAGAFASGDVLTARKASTEISTGAYRVRANQCRLVGAVELSADDALVLFVPVASDAPVFFPLFAGRNAAKGGLCDVSRMALLSYIA